MDFKTDLNERERKRYAELAHVLISILNQFHDQILDGDDTGVMASLVIFTLTGKSLIEDIAPVLDAAAALVRTTEGEIKDADWDRGLAGLLDQMDRKKKEGESG